MLTHAIGRLMAAAAATKSTATRPKRSPDHHHHHCRQKEWKSENNDLHNEQSMSVTILFYFIINLIFAGQCMCWFFCTIHTYIPCRVIFCCCWTLDRTIVCAFARSFLCVCVRTFVVVAIWLFGLQLQLKIRKHIEQLGKYLALWNVYVYCFELCGSFFAIRCTYTNTHTQTLNLCSF